MGTSPSFPALAAFPLALLVAVAAWGGIALPSTYAQETASWAAQGIGQDWVNGVLVAPLLVVLGVLAWRGSRGARLLLGGTLLYCAYSFVLYAFAVHFNRLFLVYCAALGLSFYALASLAGQALREHPEAWFGPGVPVRWIASYQIGVALLFALLWLGEDVPALLRGVAPPSLAEAGLATNPVHVLDLSFLLPALAVASVALLRGRPLGTVLSPILLMFSALLAVALGGMVLMMCLRAMPVPLLLPVLLGGMVLVSGGLLVRLLRCLRPA